MTGSVSPFAEIGTGEIVNDSEAPETCALNQPQVIQRSATQEEIQDYVAALFTGAQHQNASFTYDDESNTLTITVDSDINIDPDSPADILDAINALDGAIN